MVRRLFPNLLLALLAASIPAACGGGSHGAPDASAGDSDGDTDGETDTGSDSDTGFGPGAIATGVRITRIQLCQTVCTDLMAGLAAVEPSVPIVPGKEALVRVFYELISGWDYRSTWARFEYDAPDVGGDTISFQLVLEESSDENELDSTLNFVVPGDRVVAGLEYAFSLRENGSFVDPDGEPQALWPAEGRAEIPTVAPEQPIRIVLVPIRYDADGSGRVPDTSAEILGAFAERFRAMYPIDAVSVTVAEPFEWADPVLPSGDGWNELLAAITELRQTQGAAFEEYYYGLFDPAESFYAYCGGGCVLGLSYLAPDAGSSWARASIGVGFDAGTGASTMVHEVGHAHGLGHAPCGTGDADPEFPYADGTIGVTGYDDQSGLLVTKYAYDFMGYCDPDWVSDYDYLALYDRIVAVNAASKSAAPGGEPWRSIVVGANGAVALGPSLRLPAEPRGPAREVVWRDAARERIRAVEGRLQRLSDTAGGLVLFPEPPAGVAYVELPGHPSLPL
jgi:hypothetical protein